jgi:hypothetical protein
MRKELGSGKTLPPSSSSPSDQHAIILFRYDLRYQEVGEFIRCLKVSSKTSLDEIVVSLWNDVQQRTGKGLDTMSETGVVIDRPVPTSLYFLFLLDL